MSSSTNIPINTRSMNGIITISDGTTVLEDGNITTTGDLTVDNLLCSTFSTQNMLVNYMQILRDSNATVNAELGFTVDIGLLVQNMIFNDITRLYQIWNDTATKILLQVDVFNNIVDFGGQTRFNSFLPTTSITTGFGATNFITRAIGDGRYGLLSSGNVWTSTNSFDSFLPTSTLTPTTNTQLITKIFADTTYGQLALANTWTLTNTFSRGIVPRRFAGNGTDYQISNNSMLNRQTGSVNNIGIGNETLAGDSNSLGWQYNTGSRNIALGHLAMQFLDSGNDCIAIGYQALQNTGLSRVNGVGVTANRCIAIGNFSQRTSIFSSDNISIGHNSFFNNVSGNGNVIIATNGGGGLNGKSGCVIIGRNSCPTAVENSIISIGDGAMGGATGATLACIAIGESALYNARSSGSIGIGYRALFNLTTGFDCQAWGYQAGQSAVTATYSQFIGRGADTTLSSVVNSVCMGYGAITTENFEFVIGGLGGGDYPRLTIPNKNRINCCQYTGAIVTYTINWRSNEYVVINSATTTTINLPQAIDATAIHVGACFNIVRTHLSTSNINIVAFGTEKISWKGSLVSSVSIDSWVLSISVVCVDNVAGNGVWTIRGYNDRVTLATDANKIQTLSDSSNVNYPVCFTTLSAGTGYNNVYGNSSITYNPSTSNLTVPNLAVTNLTTTNYTITNLVANNLYIGGATVYSPYESKEILSNGNMSVPLAGLYFWTGAGSNNINLPTITADMVGARVVFCRTGTNVSTNLTVNRSGSDLIYPSGSATGATALFILSTNAPIIWRGEIMALSLGFWAVR